MRPTQDQWAMALAVVTAQRSTCIRRNVGCVLLNARGHVLATGNNGVASGQAHCNEQTALKFKTKPIRHHVPVFGHACKGHDLPPGQDSCEAIHAEQNALLQCKDVYDIHTAYVTLSPCMACCKILLNTSCRKIVFLKEWDDPKPKELWLKSGRQWELMDSQELASVIK